jgi:hypothetical protein
MLCSRVFQKRRTRHTLWCGGGGGCPSPHIRLPRLHLPRFITAVALRDRKRGIASDTGLNWTNYANYLCYYTLHKTKINRRGTECETTNYPVRRNCFYRFGGEKSDKEKNQSVSKRNWTGQLFFLVATSK